MSPLSLDSDNTFWLASHSKKQDQHTQKQKKLSDSHAAGTYTAKPIKGILKKQHKSKQGSELKPKTQPCHRATFSKQSEAGMDTAVNRKHTNCGISKQVRFAESRQNIAIVVRYRRQRFLAGLLVEQQRVRDERKLEQLAEDFKDAMKI